METVQMPIDYYSNRLVTMCKTYFDNVEAFNLSKIDPSGYSSAVARERLKIAIFSSQGSFKDRLRNCSVTTSPTTFEIIKNYFRCIMINLGKISECELMERCNEDITTNMFCINLAKMKNNIFYNHQDVNYSDYIPFSTSFKYIFYKEKSGILMKRDCPDYNPQHTTKDIAWCNRTNIFEQLKISIPKLKYYDNAKIQVKVTTNCDYLDLSQYYLTPVICFDLCQDINILKNKYPNNIVKSIYEIDAKAGMNVEKYFYILASYITGMTQFIDIKELDIKEDKKLLHMFNTPVVDLFQYDVLNKSGLIENAQKKNSPIILNT